MIDELELRLMASPTLKLATIGLGDLSSRTALELTRLRALQSVSHRRALSRQGFTRYDGSFPIKNVTDLRAAVDAYTQVDVEERPGVRRWIAQRARALSRADVLPMAWGAARREAGYDEFAKSKRTRTDGKTSNDPKGAKEFPSSDWKSAPKGMKCSRHQHGDNPPPAVAYRETKNGKMGACAAHKKEMSKGKENSLVASGAVDDGVMVAAYPPPELASTLAGGQEGDHAPEDLHVTIAYFGKNSEVPPDKMEALRQAVFDATHQLQQPINAYASGVGTFDNPESDNPRWYGIEAPGLKELRDAIVQAAEAAGVPPNTEHGFTPHMTVRYGGEPLQGVPEGGDAAWPIDAVVLKRGSSGTDVQPFGHDFMPMEDDPGLCEICSKPQADYSHDNTPVAPYLDDMQPEEETPLEDVDSTDGSSFNWVSDVGGLPKAIKEVAKHIQRGGKKNESHAIAIAVSRAKKWALESKNPKTKAKYAQAVAEWEAKKAKSHADNLAASAPWWANDLYSYMARSGVPNYIMSSLGIEEGRMTSSVRASAGAWTEGMSFFWDDETNACYAVDQAGAVSEFVGEAWEPVPNMTAADVENFPTVDDPETMEAITAAGEGETPDLSRFAGAQFEIDLVIPEGVPSGDTRSFAEGALEFLEPPFPLFWQKMSGEGHNGSVTVGKFTSIERTEAGLGRAKGVFDTSEDAIEAARQVSEGMLLGVSGDVDQFKAEMSTNDDGEEKIDIKHGRLVGATLVGKPAFQECRIKLVQTEEEQMNSLAASGGPMKPPVEWFRDPQLDGPTRLTVNDEGRVFGHIAAWGTPHTGNPAMQPPRSKTGYRFFKTGSVATAEGVDVSVGQLTLAGGHAGYELSADRAIAHYDDTKSAVADVACGEDKFGIWVSGSVRPGVPDEQVYAFRASSPSGDWRRLNGNLELVAVCQVNTPGFPVSPKAVVASGEMLTLVAAGLEQLQDERESYSHAFVTKLVDRLDSLEAAFHAREVESRRERAESTIDALRD